MSSLKGRVIAVTGAASGIGLATVRLLASKGAKLSLADIQEAPLESLKKELLADGVEVITDVVDVRDRVAVESWIQNTVAYYGQNLDGAANIAGTIGKNVGLPTGMIREITDEEFDHVLAVNAKGCLNCLRAELNNMRTGKDGRNGGSIVNASSIAGLVGVPMNSPYVASKHAIVGLTKTAAKEEGDRCIRVNAIAPGLVETPLLATVQSRTEDIFEGSAPGALKRLGTSEEAANLVAFLLSDESSFVNGMVYGLDGGWMC